MSKQYVCPSDGATVTEVGSFASPCRCPRCGGAMDLIMGREIPSDISYVDRDTVLAHVARAAPIARAMLAKGKNVNGGEFGFEMPLAAAIALVACCQGPAGWKPFEVLALAELFGSEARSAAGLG